MNEEESYPSLPEQAKNLANFSFNVVKTAVISSESPFAPEDVQEQRWEVCRSCEFFDAKAERCRHCGCFLKAKIRFTLDSCPLQKWTIKKKNHHVVKKEPTIVNHVVSGSSTQFPPNPSIGDTYQNDKKKWKYDGKVWRIDN